MTTQVTTEPPPQKGPSAPEPHWAAGKLPGYLPWTIVGGAIVLAAILIGVGMSLAASVVLAWLLLVVVLVGTSRAVEGGRKAKDRLATSLVCSSFVLALIPLGTLLWKVVSEGAPVISTQFLTYSMRNVVGGGGGIYHALMGTLIITALTALMSVPVGLLTAIYLVEYGAKSRLARSITFLVDVMTGIPSIVAGLFAYALFEIFYGPGIRMGFAGAVALSLLMVPLVVRSCEEMLKLVPNELREASYALGVSKWRTIVKVVVPTALAGIVTGVTIAIARIIGETAPLLLVAGATTSTNLNPFSDRMMTLPVFIFTSFRNPGVPPQPSYDRAWGAALVLIVIIMVLNLVARLISYLFSPKTKQ
jgi:phosphate transport system permease protein